MSFKTSGYKRDNPVNREHFRIIKRKENKRYYAKTALYKPRSWTLEECNMVLEHSMPDTELSKKIKRSVRAIQVMRSRLKRKHLN